MPFYKDRDNRRGSYRKSGDGDQGRGPHPKGEWSQKSSEKPYSRSEKPERGTSSTMRTSSTWPAQKNRSVDRALPPDRMASHQSSRAPVSGRKPTPNRRPPADRIPSPDRVRPPFDGDEPLPRENLLSGRNPIREAIKSGRDIERMLVARGELSGSAREIVAMAKERHIVVQTVERSRLDEITPNHQGMIAFASAFRYETVETMLALAKERGEDPLLVILDGVTDPHNLGAIIRSAECVGAHGVIVPERRAVGLTPAAVKASAGAVEYLPVTKVGNLARLLETLKEQGLWIVAADMSGEPYTSIDLKGPMAVIIGAEGEGVSRLLLERSDRKAALPTRGKIGSLNASVAAGVLLYEIRRQRG